MLVGFEVIPLMPWVTRSCSWPFSSQSRRRLSSQGLWPAMSYRSWRRVMGHAPLLFSASFWCVSSMGPAGQQGLGSFHHVGHRKAELLHDDGGRRRGPEVVQADRGVGVAAPTEGGPGLDAEARHAGRQDLGDV